MGPGGFTRRYAANVKMRYNFNNSINGVKNIFISMHKEPQYNRIKKRPLHIKASKVVIIVKFT